VLLFGFIIRIYHNARSPERHIPLYSMPLILPSAELFYCCVLSA